MRKGERAVNRQLSISSYLLMEWWHVASPEALTLTPDHLPDCEEKDKQIKSEAFVIHIPDIQTELLLPGNGITTINLGPTTEARLHMVATGLLR